MYLGRNLGNISRDSSTSLVLFCSMETMLGTKPDDGQRALLGSASVISQLICNPRLLLPPRAHGDVKPRAGSGSWVR